MKYNANFICSQFCDYNENQEEFEVDKTTRNMAGGEDQRRWTVRDYVTLGVYSQTPSITRLPMTANVIAQP